MMRVKRWVWSLSLVALFTPISWAVAQPQTVAELAAMDTAALDETAQFELWALAAQKGWSWQAVSPHLDPGSINAQGRNLAHLAARFGRTDWLVHLPSKLIKQADDLDNLPIHSAAWAGQLQAVRWLAARGTSLGVMNQQGWQPLHMAVFNGHKPLVRWLLAHHAPVNGVTRDGWTPLGLAIAQDACDLVADLRAAGADITQTVRVYGQVLTPLQLAQALGLTACIAALQSS